jgi:tetratricopeptide (TPR) repeat protein
MRGVDSDKKSVILSHKTTRNVQNSRVWYAVDPAINFQQTIVETGYMYAVCPSSGKILKSDSSQICASAIAFGEHELDTASIFYRFVGEEVFYVIALEFQSDKGYIYFPRLDLVIKLKNGLHCLMNADIINRFKADTVTNWKAVKSYISNNTKKEVVALLGIVYANLGHYFWNEITGIQFLLENEILDKIDKFLLGKYGDAFNVGEIFPEISSDKLQPVLEKQSISKLMLENNYLAVRVTDVRVKQELANRIYDNALKKCAEAFVEKIEKAKKHFPLLWINLRGHDKVWSSRVEGYANIINALYRDYPNMAIAFDGFPDEKTTMEKILALIPNEITTYDALDCPLYETIVWAYSIDSYIAVISAGLTLVTWLANKPGVAHCNFGHTSDQGPWWGDVRENGIKPMFVPADSIVDLDEGHSPYCDYDFDWQLIYDRLIKIHQKYYPQQLPDSWYRGEITAQKYLAAKPGKKVDIEVIVKNLSQVIWYGDVDFSWMRCGNHWLDENGKLLQNDDGRVAFKKDVKPQEEIELILTVTAPKTEGSYLLELDLVQEGVTWFKNKGFPTAKVEVEVKAYSPSDSGPKSEVKKPPVVAEKTLKILENGSYKDCLKLGETLEKEGKLDEAFAAFQRAIALNPNYSWSYHNLGKVLQKQGKLDEAANAYRRAIELNPNFHWSHYNLGEVLEKQGKLEEAIAAFRVAIELYPKLSLYESKLEKLRLQ